jgi:hypothetical protein
MENKHENNIKAEVKYSLFQTFTLLWTLYSFFWVILRRQNFKCQRFGTTCLFHLHRPVSPPSNLPRFHLSQTFTRTNTSAIAPQLFLLFARSMQMGQCVSSFRFNFHIASNYRQLWLAWCASKCATKSSYMDVKPLQRSLVWTEVPQSPQDSDMFCDVALNLPNTIQSTATPTQRHRFCINF